MLRAPTSFTDIYWNVTPTILEERCGRVEIPRRRLFILLLRKFFVVGILKHGRRQSSRGTSTERRGLEVPFPADSAH